MPFVLAYDLLGLEHNGVVVWVLLCLIFWRKSLNEHVCECCGFYFVFLGLHIWLGVNEWMNEWMVGFYGDFRVRVSMEYLWLVFQVSPPSPPPTHKEFFSSPILWYWEFGKNNFQKTTFKFGLVYNNNRKTPKKIQMISKNFLNSLKNLIFKKTKFIEKEFQKLAKFP